VLEVKGKRILLLQGPNGPFFRRLYAELSAAGARVDKVNLNAAEALYFVGRPSIPFKGRAEDWPAFVRELIARQNYDLCFLFGDCRPYHAAAKPILEASGVRVFVFEDGYLRPDFLTVERSGVNGRSNSRNQLPELEGVVSPPDPEHVPHPFGWSVLHTIVNSLAVTLGALLYPHYRHHRDVNTARQAMLWARSGLRHFYYRLREKRWEEHFRTDLDKQYFLVGLQVHNDYQVKNSKYDDVEDFIVEVFESFARSGPKDVRLVFKHHPADRAYRDYARLIGMLERLHGLEGRVVYVHDVHLPTLLKHARGTVVINSTIGWSSLHHRTPVFTMDDTIYGFFGLSAPGTLDEFWNRPPKVKNKRVDAVTAWLRRNNQANGSVWTRLSSAGPSGIHWPEDFSID
jgi:capsule polysaccharide modification protein KpsS